MIEQRGSFIHLMKSGSKTIHVNRKRKTFELAEIPLSKADPNEESKDESDKMNVDEETFKDVTGLLRKKG